MFSLDFLIFFGVITAVGYGIHYATERYRESRRIQIDLNEDIESAFDERLLDIDRLRRDPSFVLQLRGKVDSVVFLNDADASESEYEQVESIVIDSNGAIHTLEVTFDEDFEWPANARRPTGVNRQAGPMVEANRIKHIARRNVEIEENARWLAETLDVPFDSR